MSNTKQLGLGCLQYAQDYDETLPRTAIQVTGGYYGWENAIYPYVKNDQIFTCPSNRSYRYTASSPLTYSPCGYAYMGPNGTVTLSSKSLGEVKTPSTCVMLADSPSDGYYVIDGTLDRTTDNGSSPEPRHNDGANFCFVDGHSKWLNKTAYSSWSGSVAPPDPSMWTP